MELGSLYTELILEHNRDTRNKKVIEDPTHVERGVNPSCGDDIKLQLHVEDGIIEDAAYTGTGCAISQASASMMIDLIKGLSVEEALEKTEVFLGMITRKIDDIDYLEDELDEATAFYNIKNMPARVKCAVLSWHTLKEVLNKDK
ncbi:MAG: SUF system NifU family Fe-S cluster assembly protein [Clostridium sp.]|nr:SUF system NifU family Fe-S cluster assembly protein [Clostridium sp.]